MHSHGYEKCEGSTDVTLSASNTEPTEALSGVAGGRVSGGSWCQETTKQRKKERAGAGSGED